jgi:hypothetical protein
VTSIPATSILDGLQAVPGGFGQPTFAAFYAALTSAVRERGDTGLPPILLVMGEPLAGKSTFLSQLFVRLTQRPHPPEERGSDRHLQVSSPPPAHRERGSGGEGIRPYLVRWGDTIRAAKQLGDVDPERQFGDLTPDEFARTSARLGEAASAAQQAATGQGSSLVVVEAPGVTMVTDRSGQPRGLDRGYSLARRLAQREDGFLLVLCADRRVRDANLGTREARLATGGSEVREATQLAANRIHQQVTDLLYDLTTEGTLSLPERSLPDPLTRESLECDPDYRNDAVLRSYLPYLLGHDLEIPASRAFIGLNGYLGDGVKPDLALLDAYDWTHRHFGL